MLHFGIFLLGYSSGLITMILIAIGFIIKDGDDDEKNRK